VTMLGDESPVVSISASRSRHGLIDECNRLQKVLLEFNTKYLGPLDKLPNNVSQPFVLFLGNHSSGKSSFINYLLDRKVQVTGQCALIHSNSLVCLNRHNILVGVAPTDDCFTIIMPGKDDVDKDGPSVVGDPNLGFQGLSQFGPTLTNKTQLKIRKLESIRDFMIIDSPGMIDSPVMREPVGGSSSVPTRDRGYDFDGVCRWYAERADVIMLFFDPEKPGTTSETLSILTTALVGLEYKLHIVLNKSDQFQTIHDFARAYGALCWNLSKVIQRKDLPRIYTLGLPPQLVPQSHYLNDIFTSPARPSPASSITPAKENAAQEISIVANKFFDLDATRYRLQT
jgi:GTPase SAR1 family protein